MCEKKSFGGVGHATTEDFMNGGEQLIRSDDITPTFHSLRGQRSQVSLLLVKGHKCRSE